MHRREIEYIFENTILVSITIGSQTLSREFLYKTILRFVRERQYEIFLRDFVFRNKLNMKNFIIETRIIKSLMEEKILS